MEVLRSVKQTYGIFWIGFSLRIVVSLTTSEVDAAQHGLTDRHAVTGQSRNFQGPSLQGSADTSQYIAANEQPSQDAEPRRREQNQSEEDTHPPTPVGIAPEDRKEGGSQWLLRSLFPSGPGVLTPKGTLIVDPYLQYAHLSSNQVTLTGFTIVPAITVGLINVQRVSRDIYTAALVGRYGITNRLEIAVRVPYLYREDSITQRPLLVPSQADTVSTSHGSGLGDVETTIRFQINEGGPDKPYLIGITRFKSTTGRGPFDVPTNPVTGVQTELPTGSGFYIIQPGLSFLFPTDPVVIFGSASFIYNMPRNVGGTIGRVDPGSGGNANLGVGVSLNEKLSLMLAYDHTIFAKPTSASNLLLTTTPQATQIGVLLIGGTYRWSDRSFLNFVVGVGATREAPDLQLTFRMPTTFRLWE